MQVKKQQLEPDMEQSVQFSSVSQLCPTPCDPMEQWTGSKLRKECVKAVYCHPAYLTSVKGEVKVVQSCLTLCDPVDCSLPGSSVHRILQAIMLEWVSCSAG